MENGNTNTFSLNSKNFICEIILLETKEFSICIIRLKKKHLFRPIIILRCKPLFCTNIMYKQIDQYFRHQKHFKNVNFWRKEIFCHKLTRCYFAL